METIVSNLDVVWAEALDIWTKGGWCMPAIAAVALILFTIGMKVQLQFREKGFLQVPEATWRRWVHRPDEREGPIGELLESVVGVPTLDELRTSIEEVIATEVAPFDRDLRVMKVCISAAPLLGLLGTVTGMLSTFQALAVGSGGDKTMALVAKGISEALITTETGLVVALPGLFFLYLLTRKHDRYKAFLAHVETVCTQNLYRRLREGAPQASPGLGPVNAVPAAPTRTAELALPGAAGR